MIRIHTDMHIGGEDQPQRALDYQQGLRTLVLIVRGEHLHDHFTREQSDRDPNPNDDDGASQRDGTPSRHPLV